MAVGGKLRRKPVPKKSNKNNNNKKKTERREAAMQRHSIRKRVQFVPFESADFVAAKIKAKAKGRAPTTTTATALQRRPTTTTATPTGRGRKRERKLSEVTKQVRATKVKKATGPRPKGNARLQPRPDVKVPAENPYIWDDSDNNASNNNQSIRTFHRRLIRALLRRDVAGALAVIRDKKRFVPAAIGRRWSMQAGPFPFDLLIDLELKDAEKICKAIDDATNEKGRVQEDEPVLLAKATTGRANYMMLGRHTRRIEAARGGREGVNALLHDMCEEVPDLLSTMVEKNRPLSDIVKIASNKTILAVLQHQGLMSSVDELSGRILEAVRCGHRKLAADIASAYGQDDFNKLHFATLRGEGEPLEKVLAVSVRKKAMMGGSITPAHTAAINPNVIYLKSLRTVEPNALFALDSQHWQPIHYAAVCEETAPLEYLLSQGISPTVINRRGETPLHLAAQANRGHNVKVLLAAIKQFEQAEEEKDKNEDSEGNEDGDDDDNEEEPAAKKPKRKPVGSMVNGKTRAKGWTPLHIATLEGHREVVEILLSDERVSVDEPSSVTDGKKTALMMAAAEGHLSIARLLVEKGGALIDGKTDKLKRTAFIHATINGQEHVAAWLLSLGSSPMAADSSGHTALHYAAAYGWLGIIRLILSVDENAAIARSSWGLSPLSVAYLKGEWEIVRHFLQHSKVVDINGQDLNGATLMTTLVSSLPPTKILVDQVDYLLSCGSDCSIADSKGFTPLHVLASTEVQFKLAQGAQDEKENAKRLQPNEYRRLLDELITRGKATLDAVEAEGATPVQLALKHGNLPFLEWAMNRTDGHTLFREVEGISTDQKQPNVLHHLFGIPFKVAPQCRRTAQETVKFADVTQLFRALADVKPDDCKRWLEGVNAEGNTPLIEFCRKLIEGGANQTEEFRKKAVELIELAVDLHPALLLHSGEAPTAETDKAKKETTRTLVHIILQSKDVQSVLGSLLERAAKKQMLLEVLSLRDAQNRTPLLYALDAGLTEVAALIIQLARKEKCSTPILNHRIETKFDPITNQDEPFHCTVGMLMAWKQHASLFRDDLAQGVLWAEVDNNGDTAAHYAARVCTPLTASILVHIMDRCPSLASLRNKKGETPLMVAVRACVVPRGGVAQPDLLVDPVVALLVHGSVDQLDLEQRTILHAAFGSVAAGAPSKTMASVNRSDPIALLSVLLDAVPQELITSRDVLGNTVLHYAAACDSTICTVALIRRNAGLIRVQNAAGNTPLAVAVAQKAAGVALALIQADADLLGVVYPETAAESSQETEKAWEWRGAPSQKTVSTGTEKPIVSLIVRNEWLGVVHVTLEQMHKTPASVASLCRAALEYGQYNMGFSLLRILQQTIDLSGRVAAKKDVRDANLFYTFVNTFKERTLTESSRRVADLLCSVDGGWTDDESAENVEPRAELILECAVSKGLFTFLDYFQTTNATAWQRIVSSPKSSIWRGFCRYWLSKTTTSTELETCRGWMKRIKDHPILGGQRIDAPFEMQHVGFAGLAPVLKTADGSDDSSVWIPALCYAAANGNMQLAKELLSLGAQRNAVERPSLKSAHMIALEVNSTAVLGLLLDSDYKISEADDAPPPQVQYGRGYGTFGSFHHRAFGQMNHRGFRIRPTAMKLATRAKSGSSDGGSSSSSEGEEEEEEEKEEDEEHDESGDVDMEGEGSDKEKKKKKKKSADKVQFRLSSPLHINWSHRDVKGNTIFHYLVAPCGWQRTDIFAELSRIAGAQQTKKLLSDENKDGESPLEVAERLKQPKMAAAMQKTLGKPFCPPKASPVVAPRSELNVQADFEAYKQKVERLEQEKAAGNSAKTALKPDEASGLQDTGTLEVCGQTGRPFDVLMTCTNVKYGQFGFYNYYKMQLIKKRNVDLWMLFTNWGRIGDMCGGQHQCTPFSTLAEGVKEFESIFRSKTGNLWESGLDGFDPKPNKYRLLEKGTCGRASALLEHAVLPKRVAREKINEDAVRFALQDMTDLDALKTYQVNVDRYKSYTMSPLGNVSDQSIREINDAMNELATLITDAEALIRDQKRTPDEKNAQLLDIISRQGELSNKVYARLPLRGMGFMALPVLNTQDDIDRIKKVLVDVRHVEVATSLICAAQSSTIDPIQYIREALGCRLTPLKEDDLTAQRILQAIEPSPHRNQVLSIIRLDSFKPATTFAEFASDLDQRWLWHGTKPQNLLSILRDGLLAQPANSLQCGQLHGSGVYLADIIEKAINYATQSSSNVRYVLLCQAALGRVREQTEYQNDMTNVIKNFDTLFVRGQVEPRSSHWISVEGASLAVGDRVQRTRFVGQCAEYVVQNERRVLPRFLVIFKQ